MSELEQQLLRPEAGSRPWDNNYVRDPLFKDIETGEAQTDGSAADTGYRPPCCGGRCSYVFCGASTLLVVVALSLCTYFVVLPSYTSAMLVSAGISFDEVGLQSSEGDKLSAVMSVTGRLLHVEAIPSLVTRAELRAGHTTIGLDLEGNTIGSLEITDPISAPLGGGSASFQLNAAMSLQEGDVSSPMPSFNRPPLHFYLGRPLTKVLVIQELSRFSSFGHDFLYNESVQMTMKATSAQVDLTILNAFTITVGSVHFEKVVTLGAGNGLKNVSHCCHFPHSNLSSVDVFPVGSVDFD